MRTASIGVRVLMWRCLLPGMMLVLVFPALNFTAAGQTAPLRISQVSPAEMSQGSSATLTITGSGFTKGCYVSFSSPAVRVLSTAFRRDSELEAKVEVGSKAMTGPVTLFVANPEGLSAQIAFSIVASGPAPVSAEAPTASTGPVISSVAPQSAVAGTSVTIKVKGKGFVKGVSVSFSNPGIEVLGTTYSKATELSAKIRIAPNAATGSSGLFVVNPDESEAESNFSVTASAGGSGAKSANAKPGSASAAPTESFNVINIGDAVSALQKAGKPQGTLALSENHLEYSEQGQKIFSVPLNEIREVAENVFFGINTGTFHVILTSGKTYNFIAASLSPQATEAIVSSLQRALR